MKQLNCVSYFPLCNCVVRLCYFFFSSLPPPSWRPNYYCLASTRLPTSNLQRATNFAGFFSFLVSCFLLLVSCFSSHHIISHPQSHCNTSQNITLHHIVSYRIAMSCVFMNLKISSEHTPIDCWQLCFICNLLAD